LAGPVVAAAVVLPRGFDVTGINDSKKLTRLQREEQAERIKAKARWAVAIVEVDEIDKLNILWASMAAMERALSQLPWAPKRILVDGDRVPLGISVSARPIVKGDGKMACIAAASILAKTARDAIMRDLALEYPGYGFEKHYGYSTPQHLDALERLGPGPIHRRSFTRIREAGQACLIFDE
jgi:ribonuclease HII